MTRMARMLYSAVCCVVLRPTLSASPRSRDPAPRVTGTTVVAKTLASSSRLRRKCRIHVIINCDADLTYKLGAEDLLLPFLHVPVLSHDIVLRKPRGFRARVVHDVY